MNEANEKVFGMYSEYYDLLYRDKNYKAEADYVLSLVDEYNPGAKKLADLGCGTGKHAVEFCRKGYSVTGIELSASMLRLAEENKKTSCPGIKDLKFVQGDISEFKTDEKYDAALALFHVMGYLTSNSELLSGIKNIGRHLNKGGILIFDFWYGPAVLTQRPEERKKILKGNGLTIKRKAIPNILINENIVEVKYHIEAEADSGGEKLELDETHNMRYFFLPEIRLLLEQNGYKILKMEEWMTGKELSEDSWSGVCVAKFDQNNF